MWNLTFTLHDAGEADAAVRLLRKCLAGQRKVLGDNHPDTVAAAEFLSRLESQIGRAEL